MTIEFVTQSVVGIMSLCVTAHQQVRKALEGGNIMLLLYLAGHKYIEEVALFFVVEVWTHPACRQAG